MLEGYHTMTSTLRVDKSYRQISQEGKETLWVCYLPRSKVTVPLAVLSVRERDLTETFQNKVRCAVVLAPLYVAVITDFSN